MDDVVQWILEHVDQTYRKGNWAGRGVLPAIEGVDAGAAHWRPHPEQHTIAEITLHMGYWKDAAGTRVAGRPWTYDEQQDWRGVPATDQGWSQARTELERAHQRLMQDLHSLGTDRLLAPLRKTEWETRSLRTIDLAVDIATHDHYHAAQIFVLKRLYAGAATLSQA
ncbi:MAG: DinB family protein [Bacillati bacterium ANGP1]|uniref:DinB family protein n=1 Tax=Candidatus Segetimicrobium genomatis TaxID=2569760 RepID=A0A537KY53_9BACT|nr:MAG: DinB family protein [Terrabacteria group bacterium ANGP1]